MIIAKKLKLQIHLKVFFGQKLAKKTPDKTIRGVMCENY